VVGLSIIQTHELTFLYLAGRSFGRQWQIGEGLAILRIGLATKRYSERAPFLTSATGNMHRNMCTLRFTWVDIASVHRLLIILARCISRLVIVARRSLDSGCPVGRIIWLLPTMLKDRLYEKFGSHSQNPYDQCKTLA
jgi:hypothetical protein